MPRRTTVICAFRILAVAEARSWAALLAGMYFKWIAGTSELGVQVTGNLSAAGAAETTAALEPSRI